MSEWNTAFAPRPLPCFCGVFDYPCPIECPFLFEAAPPEERTGELTDVTDVRELSNWPHELYKVTRWASDSESGETSDDRHVAEVGDADIIASKIAGSGMHTVMLDLDVPAKLVPSSTPGHSHLYIDRPLSWDAYCILLDALVLAGVVEEGYAGASKARGYTALRLPWIKKRQPDDEQPAF